MTSKAYMLPEARISFLNTGGTAAFTCTSIATLAGRQSAQHDFGVSARAYQFNWTAFFKSGAATPVVGETVDVYLKYEGADGHITNDDGTADAALSALDKTKNLHYIGSITIDEALNTVEFVKKGSVTIKHQKVQVVFYNATAGSFSTTAADHGFILEPVAIQGQAT